MSDLTGISVAYSNQIRGPKVKMSKKARRAARQRLRNDGEGPKPFGMSATRRRLRPSDPSQNSPNEHAIIPKGQGPL